MMPHGMVDEGVECIANIRRRYDGEKANPYDETEYGRHYARAMASWAAIPVLSGFHYDARKGRMELAPKLTPASFLSFWSAPIAWGTFELSPGSLLLSVVTGSVSLKELMIAPFPSGVKLRVNSGEKDVAHRVSASGKGVLLSFSSAVTIDIDRPLRVRA